jgi:hypothetical protein
MPRTLYPNGNSPWYPLDRRLGGPQRWFGHAGEEKNLLNLSGIQPWFLSHPDCGYTDWATPVPVMLCSPEELSELQSKTSNYLTACFFHVLLVDPEDSGSTFLQNTGGLLLNYMVLDRLERILTMVYVVQSYWACFGLYPSSSDWD